MAELLEVDSTRERISRRELYRRFSHIGEELIEVAERIVYAVVKESELPAPAKARAADEIETLRRIYAGWERGTSRWR